ncbi:acetyl-CoA carboxylase biotin carboxyl carrier protein [Edaphobacter modestus]|uniref:Biotin carboxyl carrier protein of acetyl-CoA carboxylase n=2 Tax=Edaphobacter modestus TaxID=388466 RepID=A0A4Q7YMT0_9BACT|nr:acetyl-CoA carboxylase biotin carboxyl carrier protein [Edaphobacter modestus]RZU39052.1 acetyl-CoA carboxylase biotin carboxyl carrier protein [Edaphobacter modestus]
MDGTKMQELRELVEFLKANEIAEFDMEQADLKVRIKFAGEPAPAAVSGGIDLAQLSRLIGSAPASQAPLAPVASGSSAATTAAAPAAEATEKLHEVKSPIVGTFYESPAPGASAFVQVGDKVEVGQVLCIVEAMKLMNEIESDIAGEVVRRIASSGQPVEYGQPLFEIRPR